MRVAGFLFFLMAVGEGAQGASLAPDFQVTFAESGGKLKVVAVPPANNHFNIPAPGYLQVEGTSERIKPSLKTEPRVEFDLAPKASPLTMTVSLYLCDDKKTYCERHDVKTTWTGKVPAPAPEKPKGPAAKSKTGSVGDVCPTCSLKPENIFAEAKAKGKPLLVEFATLWCPACNMLEQTVLKSSAFKKASERFIRLRLDGDDESSFPYKTRYKIGGYPTLLFLSSDGEEISRIVGYQDTDRVVAQTKLAWESRERGLSALRAQADAGDLAAAAKLGVALLERQEFEEASRYLAIVPEKREKLLAAELGLLKKRKETGDPQARDQFQAALERGIGEFPQTLDSIERRLELGDVYSEKKLDAKKKATLNEAVRVALSLTRQPEKLRADGATAADLYELAAYAREEGEGAEAARPLWKDAATAYKKQKVSALDRGNSLGMAYCLMKAGDYSGADAIYSKLAERYPREFTFHYARANLNLEWKKLVNAEKYARTALQFAFGDNRLRAAHLLGRVLAAEGRKGQALVVVREAIAKAPRVAIEQVRTPKYIKRLEDLEKALL